MTSSVLYQYPGAFITHLGSVGYKKRGGPRTTDAFETHILDLTPLNLDIHNLTPFLISTRLSAHKTITSDQLREVFSDLDQTAKSFQRKGVLVLGGKLINLEEDLREDLGLIGIAVIDRPVIEQVLATQDPDARAKLLSASLVKFLGREALTPYVSGRPATGGRFFGRASQMKRIVPSTGNFTILGNRRIGKTSLLKEIRERLRLNNFRTGEVYGATSQSTEDVVYKVLQSLDQFRDAEKCLHRPRGLANSVHGAIENDKKPVAVFIDELDRILDFDAKQNWELLNILRETFEGHPYCRVFFAGFRRVMEVQRSLESPLFNFTNSIELPLFTRQETLDMVIKPLERLGIPVANTDLPEAVYRETAGHPELIQIHCAEIIRFVQDHDCIPSGADLLTNVFNNEDFKQKVLGAFLANTNVLEELLCYLLTADADRTGTTAEYEFGHQDVNRVLNTVSITLDLRHIDGIIHNLKVSGIISPVVGAHQKFRFSAPQLANYFIGIDLKFCIENTLQRVRESPENAGVWTELPEDEPRRLSIYDAVGRTKLV